MDELHGHGADATGAGLPVGHQGDVGRFGEQRVGRAVDEAREVAGVLVDERRQVEHGLGHRLERPAHGPHGVDQLARARAVQPHPQVGLGRGRVPAGGGVVVAGEVGEPGGRSVADEAPPEGGPEPDDQVEPAVGPVLVAGHAHRPDRRPQVLVVDAVAHAELEVVVGAGAFGEHGVLVVAHGVSVVGRRGLSRRS